LALLKVPVSVDDICAMYEHLTGRKATPEEIRELLEQRAARTVPPGSDPA
jgi:hypothetical protein